MTNSLFSVRGWNTLYTLSLTSLHNKMQGSVVLRQVKAVPLFAFIKSKWPIITYYTESQASFSISRCTGLFFCVPLSGKKWLRTPPSHLLFLGHFHFIKPQSVFYVCWGSNDTDPCGLTTGCSRGLRISPLCPRKDLKSQLSSAKLLMFFFFPWMSGVWEISILQLSFPQ